MLLKTVEVRTSSWAIVIVSTQKFHYEDWRMPARKELFDLLDTAKLDAYGINNGSPSSTADPQRSFLKINFYFNLGQCPVWTSEVSKAAVILPPELYDNVRTQLADRINIWLFSFCDGQYFIKSENGLNDGENVNRSIRTLAVRSAEAKPAPDNPGEEESVYDK